MCEKTKKLDLEACRIIDAIGGTSCVAEMCDLTTGAVSQWRLNGIPKPWSKYFMSERPDLFVGARKKAA